jgi:hypothetical protein
VHILYEVHLAKSALADHFHDNEVLKLHIISFLLPLEYECTTLLHACSRCGLLDATHLILRILIFILLVIVVVLVFVQEVFALLELLVSDLHILLQIVQLISGIIQFAFFFGYRCTQR